MQCVHKQSQIICVCIIWNYIKYIKWEVIPDFWRTLDNHNFAPCPLNQNRTTVCVTCARLLLCARKCHTCYLIEHPKQCRWQRWRTERLSNLTRVTKVTSGKGKAHTSIMCLQVQVLFTEESILFIFQYTWEEWEKN